MTQLRVVTDGPQWKLLRQKLTPLFTSAKLKNMYYIIDRSAQDFVEFLKQNPDRLKGNASDVQDTLTNFGAAALSAAVFGIGTKTTFDSPFRKMVTDAVAPSITLNLKIVLGGLSAKLYKTLGIKLFAKYEKVFVESIRQVIRQRVEEGVKKHDFVDMCVTLQKNGTMYDPETNLSIDPTDEVLAAQAYFFFIAGLEPTASVMFTTMMELGLNPDILKRVHEEVDAVFEQYHDKLTYDAVVKVQYLDRVLSESLRRYPPLGLLTRQCMKDTILPIGNIPVEKGTKIFFSIYDLHHDPNYFPNPEAFEPDRFSKEGEVPDMEYLPFGQGYRYCIGLKYARLQVLSGLMHFLRHFTVNTHVDKGVKKYEKDANRVRIKNVDIKFIPRRE